MPSTLALSALTSIVFEELASSVRPSTVVFDEIVPKPLKELLLIFQLVEFELELELEESVFADVVVSVVVSLLLLESEDDGQPASSKYQS